MTLTVVVLAVAVLRVVVLGRRASFSIGLVTIGWLYVLLVFSPWQIGTVLLPNKALVDIAIYRYDVVGFRPPIIPVTVSAVDQRAWLGNTRFAGSVNDAAAFFLSGHALVALMLGLLGGLLSRVWFSDQSKASQPQRNEERDA